MNGARPAEVEPAMTALAAKAHPQAPAADGDVSQPAQHRPFHRYHGSHTAGQLGHALTGATQVAQPFLTDVADKPERAAQLYVAAAESCKHRQHAADARRVVANSGTVHAAVGAGDAEIGCGREDRVEVG